MVISHNEISLNTVAVKLD